jgi:hypothetical protein
MRTPEETGMDGAEAHAEEDCVFGAVVASQAEAEQFKTAVFRFLELNTHLDDDRTAVISSTPGPGLRRQSVTLWSPEAARDFGVFWFRYRTEAQQRRPAYAG